MEQKPIFYVARPDQEPGGPYDLVQIADLLGKKIISGATMIRQDGEEDWKPFALLPHFDAALKMCRENASLPLDLSDQAASTSPTSILLPSSETLSKLGVGALAILVMAGGSYTIAEFNPAAGVVLMIVGLGAMMTGHALLLGKLIDEDYLTIGMVFSIPFFDLFYFLGNFKKYFPYFCAKYGGAVLGIAADYGLGANGILPWA